MTRKENEARESLKVFVAKINFPQQGKSMCWSDTKPCSFSSTSDNSCILDFFFNIRDQYLSECACVNDSLYDLIRVGG